MYKSKKNIHIPTFELYDWILSNIQAQKLMLPSEAKLSNEQIALEWGRIVTKNNIMKMYVIEKYPSWVSLGLIQRIKEDTLSGLYSVKFNYYFDLIPYTIDWGSPKMKQQLKVYQRKDENNTIDDNNVFTRRDTFAESQKLQSKKDTFEYYEHVDLDFRRTLFNTCLTIQLIGERDKLDDLDQAIVNFKNSCFSNRIEFNEFKADIFDYLRYLSPTGMRGMNNIQSKLPKTRMSDDTVASLLGRGQGKIGENGVPLGMDIFSTLPVLHVFREDRDKAENVLISASTGGGKSVFLKNTLTWALKDNVSACVLDYEGDEYTNLAQYINDGNKGDAVVIDMGNGNNRYFDPLRMPDPCGKEDIDKERKAQALSFTTSLFTVLLGEDIQNDGKENKFGITLEEKVILSKVLHKVYAEAGVTENPNTWHRSKHLRIQNVFDMLKLMTEARTFFSDKSGDDSLQKVAKRMVLKLNRYFLPGEVDYGMFGEILDLDKIRDSRLIVFSFGNKGRDNQGADNVKMALKQLTVSKITNEISNYNWYIKNKFTIKVWEEVQRFVNIPGAEEIMQNCITGGRKRGDITFVITNDLGTLLKGDTKFTRALVDNLTGYCIGYLNSQPVIDEFCETFQMQLFKSALETIKTQTEATLNKTTTGEVVESAFKSAFLVKMNPTAKSPAIQTIVKAAVDSSLFDKNIFKAGPLQKDLDFVI